MSTFTDKVKTIPFEEDDIEFDNTGIPEGIKLEELIKIIDEEIKEDD